ncbi:MAG: hypothetical protein JWP57_873, partial [Spirosoma sp.]|nr:hypothetical protein [Spirosoma sp.]
KVLKRGLVRRHKKGNCLAYSGLNWLPKTYHRRE